MVDNNIETQFTDEQLAEIRKTLDAIIETIKDIVNKVIEWIREILGNNIVTIKRKRKGKRYIPYKTKETLVEYLRRIIYE